MTGVDGGDVCWARKGGEPSHPGFVRQKVVPHDRGPAGRQLADVGDYH